MNVGTVNNPIAQYVTADRVKIKFKPDLSNPSRYRTESGYSWYNK